MENCFLLVSAIKEFIFKNWKSSSGRETISVKMIYDLLESHNFRKFGGEQ